MNIKKESAFFGIIGSIIFLVGFIYFQNQPLYPILIVSGTIFVILSFASPWYSKFKKFVKKF